jgi:hypothetical protein
MLEVFLIPAFSPGRAKVRYEAQPRGDQTEQAQVSLFKGDRLCQFLAGQISLHPWAIVLCLFMKPPKFEL